MAEPFERITVPDGDRAAWLDVRRKGVGGSDVAAIMGLSKYRSPYEVWAEKLGLVSSPDLSDNSAVQWGNILEPVIADHYKSLHKSTVVKPGSCVMRSLKRPWAQASLDYEIYVPGLGNGVLEIKTAGSRSSAEWDEGVPVYYLTQVMHYMSVTGWKFADVAVLIGGQDYREYRIMRDKDDIDSVEQAVDGFWHLVETREEPEILGIGREGSALIERYGVGEGDAECDIDPDDLESWITYNNLLKSTKATVAMYANRLKDRIGGGKSITCPSGKVVWVRSKSKKFDEKAFRESHPDLYEEFCEERERDMGIRFYERKK